MKDVPQKEIKTHSLHLWGGREEVGECLQAEDAHGHQKVVLTTRKTWLCSQMRGQQWGRRKEKPRSLLVRRNQKSRCVYIWPNDFCQHVPFALTFRHLIYLWKFPKRFSVVCLCSSGHPLFYSQKSGKGCFATGAMWGISHLPHHHQISGWPKALCEKACTFMLTPSTSGSIWGDQSLLMERHLWFHPISCFIWRYSYSCLVRRCFLLENVFCDPLSLSHWFILCLFIGMTTHSQETFHCH